MYNLFFQNKIVFFFYSRKIGENFICWHLMPGFSVEIINVWLEEIL